MSLANYYPFVTYNNLKAINLLVEAEVVKIYLEDYRLFYTYIIKNGERPDTLAYDAYGDSTLDWVIFLTNGIIDPYKDWILDEKQLISYLEKKYNTAVEKLTTTTIASSIAYYYYKGIASDTPETIASYNYNMTPATYSKLGSPAGWVAKSVWDYENEINESKREIKMMRNEFVSDFKQQVKDIFSNG